MKMKTKMKMKIWRYEDMKGHLINWSMKQKNSGFPGHVNKCVEPRARAHNRSGVLQRFAAWAIEFGLKVLFLEIPQD